MFWRCWQGLSLQCLRGVVCSVLEGPGACNVLEGRGILEGATSVLEGAASLEGACSVSVALLEDVQCFGGCDILEEALAEFWRGVAFLEGTCSVAVFWRGVAFWRRRLQCIGGCGIFGGPLHVMEGCLQCFGGTWHFGEAACSNLEECGIFGGHLQCFGVAW